MGKIRIKALGDEATEKKEQKAEKIKKEQKQARKVADVSVEPIQDVIPAKAGIQKNGSPIKSGMTDSEIATSLGPRNDKPTKKEKFAAKAKITRSQKYREVAQVVDKNKTYPIAEALTLLAKMQQAKFDETVELHINTIETGVSGSFVLPHGTGKQTRVVIADDKTIADIEKGIINFDILLSSPQMMPKLARVARVLGPKGLMPNPKSGTVTPNPEEAAKKFAGGQVNYKTEAKTPIIHLTVGKMSFGDKKIAENITMVFKSIKSDKIKNATLKSTMSPGIKLSL